MNEEKLLRCNNCQQYKALEEFSLRKDRGIGARSTICKDCIRLRNTAYSLTEAGKQSKRKWNVSKKGRLSGKQRTRNKVAAVQHTDQYYLLHPEIKHAHHVVQKAIRSGQLMRPSTCSLCGSTKNIQAHHDDYNKPLEIRWLCQLCHFHIHNKMLDQEQEFPE